MGKNIQARIKKINGFNKKEVLVEEDLLESKRLTTMIVQLR